MTYYHGSSFEFRAGEKVESGHEEAHGENDKVWVSDNAWQASKYGAFTYEVEVVGEVKRRWKGNHEFYVELAVIKEKVSNGVILEQANKLVGGSGQERFRLAAGDFEIL